MEALDIIESRLRKANIAFYMDEYCEADSDKLFLSVNDLLFHLTEIIEIIETSS